MENTATISYCISDIDNRSSLLTNNIVFNKINK